MLYESEGIYNAFRLWLVFCLYYVMDIVVSILVVLRNIKKLKKQEIPKTEGQVAVASTPVAAPRFPTAAGRPGPVAVSASQSADLDMSVISEGPHVSGTSLVLLQYCKCASA